MSFHEVRFPVEIALDSTGGPARRTEIVTLGSGFEERNATWAHSRRRYNAGYGVKTLAEMEAVIAFFEARLGRLYGFRWRDAFDHSSAIGGAAPAATDQPIGIGDGATASFQLAKTYASGGASYVRPIKKPVAGTVSLAVGGAVQTGGADYSVDATTGLISFDAGSIPAPGAAITAGFEFDTPVRFDTDQLDINLAAFQAGDIASIPLIEILIP
ncbi:MAG: DUF2460 domain-containing protein [Pseudomonadota bacterium]